MLNVAFSYPELNKWRIFFRVIFAAGTLTMVELQLGNNFTTSARILDEPDEAGKFPRKNNRQKAIQVGTP
jgi:hypothetical protein